MAKQGEVVRQPDISGYDSVYEADILKFYPPRNPSPAEQNLVADIASLDHRSIHHLRPSTPERIEVKRILWNSITSLTEQRSLDQAESLFKSAKNTYLKYIQIKNRTKYLIGSLIGLFVSAILGFGLSYSAYISTLISPNLLMATLIFSGLGSIASVLVRLSSIDLQQEVSTPLLLVSGGTKPIVASIFSIIVYLILSTKIIEIKVGGENPINNDAIYWIAAFLCGFSERFATDILSRLPFGAAEKDGK